jgi:hypothetical protein
MTPGKLLRYLTFLLICAQGLTLVLRGTELEEKTRQFVHDMGPGIDPVAARPFVNSTKSIATLRAMLLDPSEAQSWGNAIRMLGYISPYNTELVDHFVDFLESDGGPFECEQTPEPAQTYNIPMSSEDAFARQNVFWSLGYQLGKLPNQGRDVVRSGATSWKHCKRSRPIDLLSYLERGATPTFWTHVRWMSPSLYANEEQRNIDFAARSIRALGLSCRASAVEFLKAKRSELKDPILREALEEALGGCSGAR